MRQGFQFHAFATGVAAQFTAPFMETIESQAPSALAPTGGYSRGRVENFRYKELLSFRAAYTQVSGGFSEETQTWDTIMTSTVEGFDLLGMVRADLIVARLASRHSVIEDSEPSILPLGSRIEGLQIGGVAVDAECHSGLYSRLDTYSKLENAYREDPEFRAEFNRVNMIDDGVTAVEEIPTAHWRYFPWRGRPATKEIPNVRGSVTTTLVKALHPKGDYLDIRGHVVHLPQFGTVALGQIQMDGKARRVTMLEVNLGCSACGRATAGTGETNGQPDPPPHGHGK